MAETLATAGSRVTAGLLNRIYGDGDTTSHVVSAASYADLSTVRTIVAGDADVGTAYRITSVGTAAWGGTQQALSLAIALHAATGTGVTIANTAFSTSAALHWRISALITCSATSASGSYLTNLQGSINQIASNIAPGTAGTNSVPFSVTQSAVSADTTADMTFSIQAKWASTTGTPSITCLGTLFERVN